MGASCIAQNTVRTSRQTRNSSPRSDLLSTPLQHLPDSGDHLIRRYGLYSSRSRGTWSRKPYLVRLAPEGWKEQHALQSEPHLGQSHEQEPHLSVSEKETRAAWARLIANVYEAARPGSPALPPLWLEDEGDGRDHRSPAGPQNPPPPHQDRSRSPGSGPRLRQLNPLARSTAGLTPSPRSALPSDNFSYRSSIASWRQGTR